MKHTSQIVQLKAQYSQTAQSQPKTTNDDSSQKEMN